VIRSFIAFDLPQSVLDELGRVRDEMKKDVEGVKWVNPRSIHLTLQFLGNISEELVEELKAPIDQSMEGFQPLELALDRVGAFPNPRNPRVIWMGITGQTDRLALIKQRLDTLLEPLGFKPEKRSFKPHLTLGRVKKLKNPAMLRTRLEQSAVADHRSFMVTKIVLYKSQLFPDGAQYTPLYSVGGD